MAESVTGGLWASSSMRCSLVSLASVSHLQKSLNAFAAFAHRLSGERLFFMRVSQPCCAIGLDLMVAVSE